MKKIAILLVNLGSPKSTSVSDVKDYLHQFLSDQRVIEANPLMWKFILNCFILPFRPKQSAEKYKQIWLANNQSPLIFYTQQQTKLLQNLLNNFDSNNNYKFYVDYAMRYGDIELSISKKLDNLLLLETINGKLITNINKKATLPLNTSITLNINVPIITDN